MLKNKTWPPLFVFFNDLDFFYAHNNDKAEANFIHS